MKTIPERWHFGKDPDNRDTWFNNRGKPIILCRIQRLTGGYIRIGSASVSFAEEGGQQREYDSTYFNSISDIEMSLNFLKGNIGAIGQMGQSTIELNNGEVDGDKFTDTYDLDQLTNATVDVFLIFKEVDLVFNNAMQIYKGVITNYNLKSANITLRINEFSNTKHKMIPSRIDEFKEEHELNWTIPKNNTSKIIPICFGTGMFRAYLINVLDGTPRYYFIAYHYKDIRSNPKASLFYYDPKIRRYVDIAVNLYSEHSCLGGDLYLIRFDIEDFTEFSEEMNHYIPAHKIDVNYSATGYPRVIHKDKLFDRAKADIGDAAVANEWMFDYGVYTESFAAWFEKNLFETKGNFDLYVCFEGSYQTGAEGNPNEWSGQWHGHWFSLSPEFDVDDAWDAVNSHAYNNFIPAEYLPEGHLVSSDPKLLQKNMTIDDITTEFPYCSLRLKRILGNHPLYLYEIALRQTMLCLPRDFYVSDNFGNNIINDAINFVFTNFLDIDSGNISYKNFQGEYKIDGQVNEEIDSYEFFTKLAQQFGIIFFEDTEGKERFIDIHPSTADFTITDEDIKENDDGTLQIEQKVNDEDIYSMFFVDYKYNIATKEYEASKYVTKDSHNISYLDSNKMQQLCYNAYKDYHSEKRLSLKLDFVRDDQTAERILGKLIQLYTMKKHIINFNAIGLRLIDLEIGDQIQLNATGFTFVNNFYIMKNKVNYNQKTSEFILLESPWKNEAMPTDTVDAIIDIGEDIVHVLKTP